MVKLSYLEAIRQVQGLASQQNKDVFILGEDVGKEGGAFGIAQGLQQQYGEDRVIDMPLTESNTAGTVIGAAMVGRRPIAEIQFADSILPATNQIISEAAKMCYHSSNDWQCPLTIYASFGGSVHGGLYHSQDIEGVFASSPGLTIAIPSTSYDAKGLLLSSTESNDLVLYFEHKRAYRFLKEEVPEEYYTVPLGKADAKRGGKDLTASCYELMVNYCLQAADTLVTDGIDVEVVDLRTVYPLGRETTTDRAKHIDKVLLVTEDNSEDSIISEVSAIIAEYCLFGLDVSIMRLAVPDVSSMPSPLVLENEIMMGPEKTLDEMRELAES